MSHVTLVGVAHGQAFRSYWGHGSQVVQVRFTGDDDYLITAGAWLPACLPAPHPSPRLGAGVLALPCGTSLAAMRRPGKRVEETAASPAD